MLKKLDEPHPVIKAIIDDQQYDTCIAGAYIILSLQTQCLPIYTGIGRIHVRICLHLISNGAKLIP